MQEPPKAELVKGKVWHETYEMMNNAEERLVSSIRSKDTQQILDMYRAEYSKFLRNTIIRNKTGLKGFDISMIDLFKEYWPDFEEEAKVHALNVISFIERNDVYGKDLWEKLTPKIFAEQKFRSERLNLVGVIDVLEVHDINGDKSYVPIELKTGACPDDGIWEGHRIQLAAYMLLLEDAKKTVTGAAIRYKGAQRRLLLMNTFLRDEVLELIRKTDDLLKSSDLPPITDNRNKCRTCYYREKCHDETKMNELLRDASMKRSTGITTNPF